MKARILTPTFQLTPVEKPDSSPFLIHVTKKKSLVDILNGKNLPEGRELPEKCGFIKSTIPLYGSEKFYDSPVVCFTESPVFAIDFFRFRSYRRMAEGQQFGIGFSKQKLIQIGKVRPVLYLDTSTNSQLLSLCKKAAKPETKFSKDENENNRIKSLLSKIKPLLFPLLETEPLQGFIWEREWRYPHDDGLIFSYSSVKIICCPRDERDAIVDILGEQSKEIDIIESWKEYEEVTNYLKMRQQDFNADALDNIDAITKVEDLRNLKNKNDQMLNLLREYYNSYKEAINRIESQNISKIIERMEDKSKQLNDKMKVVSKEQTRVQE